jgi:hypothetical protein
MVVLPKDANQAGLEDFIKEIQQYPGQDLRFPIHTSRGGSFGFSGTCLQAIATWARNYDGSKSIHLPPNFGIEDSTRDRFASTLHGMAALYFCDAVKSGELRIKRAEALAAVAPRVRAMVEREYRDTLRGRGIALCCFEGADAEYLPSLYSIPERGDQHRTTVRSNADLKRIVTELLDVCVPGVSAKITEIQKEVLGNLIHQLFKNADVHTATNADGSLSSKGLRGIQIRYVSLDSIEAIQDFTLDDNILRGYLGKVNWILDSKQKVQGVKRSVMKPRKATHFIEITVFDTGPGLALRWLSETKNVSKYADLSLDEELTALLSCFRLHSTTHTSDMRGDGLEIAMLAMKQLKAFMFLRSGRLALVQDFSTGEHKGFTPKDRYGSRRKLGEVVGTSYSICFPLPI